MHQDESGSCGREILLFGSSPGLSRGPDDQAAAGVQDGGNLLESRRQSLIREEGRDVS